MPRFRYKLQFYRTVVVEADDVPQEDAWHGAVAAATVRRDGESHQVISFVQLGEPWLRIRRSGWYDVNTREIVVFERAAGSVFDHADVFILCHRLASLGLSVDDYWNGPGCSSVSFRCAGRVGNDDFTPAEQNFLFAPRPPPLALEGSVR